MLEVVRTAQNQNGLRHADYARYRAYCTRKLRRLRCARLIGLRQGTGKRWRSLPALLAAEGIAYEPRHLQLLLFQAERAWAHCQELKGAVDEMLHRMSDA